ncbi:double zinc ribbon [Methanobrevibacter woesei]|uniref:Double zinc ribbon n=1 Tax=Methanobrevibacter woesei TaxID=190976 RepID=A0A2U1S7S9_9EURY|nr:zinc ribbon domain-containing protein [Methanobrevibacter woesei]PWB86145.1 double zinc ribbon [Methanobrevibacter woesei]
MFCPKCGKAIKDDAKFCKYCGTQVSKNNQSVNVKSDTSSDSKNNSNTKILAVAIVVAAIVLVALVFTALSLTSDNGGDDAKAVEANKESSVAVTSSSSQSSSASAEKSWVSVGSFSGSGSGSQTISVPSGEIRIDISAFPIKNYATNHLYLTGSNGESAGVDWGSTSAVASKSDSLSFTSSSTTTFTIDYFETESWSVEVYKYQ